LITASALASRWSCGFKAMNMRPSLRVAVRRRRRCSSRPRQRLDPAAGVDDRLLPFDHGGKGNILRRLGDADDHSGVLLGKNTGNDHIEDIRSRRSCPSITIRVANWWRNDLEPALIEGKQPVEAVLHIR
jgi:hypothetical protein